MAVMDSSSSSAVPTKRRGGQDGAGPSTFEQELQRIHVESQHGIFEGVDLRLI